MLRYHERATRRLDEHGARQRADGTVQVGGDERARQQAAVRLPPDLSRIGTWKASLSEEECRQFEAIAGAVLKDFGYRP